MHNLYMLTGNQLRHQARHREQLSRAKCKLQRIRDYMSPSHFGGDAWEEADAEVAAALDEVKTERDFLKDSWL